jgi:type I restriction enzyme, S subunit
MPDKILNSFDLWIAAQGWKSKLRLKSIDNISLEGIISLRQLILSLAMQGKLTPTNPDERCPTDQEIGSLKNRYYKTTKTKPKDYRFDPPLINEFNLPNTWKWKRVGDLCDLQTGATPSTQRKEYFDGNIRWLVSGDINRGIIEECEGRISEEGLKNSNCKILPVNTILIALNGQGKTRASVALLKVPAACNQSLVGIIPFACTILDSKFLMLSLKLRYYEIRDITGQKQRRGLNMGLISNLSIPLPPITQQHSIVAKVEELMALCDELEQQEKKHLKSHKLLVETLLGTLTRAKDAAEFQTSWAMFARNFDDLFITEDSVDQLKQTILQLAVMGKLVTQDPKDEPASVLLEKIRKAKERLVEEGKIKKEKSLPEIQESEIPFKSPSTWKFARLGEITNKIGSGSTPRGGRQSYANEGVLFLRSQNIRDHGLELSDVAFITDETHEIMSGTKVYPNDILLNITGGSLGRSTIFPDRADEANVSQHVTIIRPTNPEIRFFLHFCIVSPYGQELIWGRQVGANREGLSKKVLELFEIPIPPLNEQKRIIGKVNELFVLCDRLKERITESQKVVNHMADSILSQIT